MPGDTTSLVPGFPIRTSSDPRSVDSSPRHIAASHVLHRLLKPRHPPCALNNLTTKMLASTLQFSNTTPRNNTQPPTPTHKRGPPVPGVLPQDPTACQQTPDPKPQPHAFHTPPTTGTAVLTQAGRLPHQHQPVAPQFLEQPDSTTNGHSAWPPHHTLTPQQTRVRGRWMCCAP